MVGTAIAHYRVLDRLGEGGMGEVYLVEDTRLQRRAALKLLSHSVTLDEGGRPFAAGGGRPACRRASLWRKGAQRKPSPSIDA